MMKKYFLFVLCVTAFFLLIGCQENSTLSEEASVQKRPMSENGISIKIEKLEYHTSAEKITVMIRNDSDEDFTTGTHVFLEKKVGGTWYKVPMKDISFTEEGLLISPDKSSSLSIEIQDLRDKFASGEYRATIGGLAAPFEVVHIEKD